MNAIEAHKRLILLDERINALDVAYEILWSDFDKRLYAIELNKIQLDYEQERTELVSRLAAVNL